MTTSSDQQVFAPSRATVASGALFTDPVGRVMLVKPTYKPGWDIPGGYVESDETPRQACAREVREELGLSITPGRLLVVDWAPTAEGPKILFVFDGGILTDEQHDVIVLERDELSKYRYVALDDLLDFTIPRLARRVRAAASTVETCYLEPDPSTVAHVGATEPASN